MIFVSHMRYYVKRIVGGCLRDVKCINKRSIEFMDAQTRTEQKAEFTTIYVSKETRKMLARIKIESDLRTYDEVIRYLLRHAGYGDQ